ncbi:succinate dehydrogenase cytochrome b560 subunit, mitochondrial-like [Corticium candelabrum]|uniref:succinate dehydrogenase cytochrome b560 subunit, mitochondrial-like n=1 Tax=Corticium candelabrum TaxID=121492 RepID=UPI002E25677C|nr:succinate dehydrogenase cytochrome b560 subunit, mitochondrial-like [Corticium candelabrum]
MRTDMALVRCVRPLLFYRPPLQCCGALISRATLGTGVDAKPLIERNVRLGRPLSPHVGIYKFGNNMIMSITHRATGMMLAGGLVSFGIGMLITRDVNTMLSALQSLHLSPSIIFLEKLCCAFPFTYHTLNGLRHLAWDMAIGLNMPAIYRSSYVVLLLSLITTGIFAAWY